MNELSERLAARDETLAKLSIIPNIPSEAEIKDFILGFKNLKTTRALIEALVDNIIVDPTDGSYTLKFGLSHFRTD